MKKRVLDQQRIRHIEGGFGFIPHRFLTDEFLASLLREEILLYFFLVLASDRYGLSFYSYDAICSLLQLSVDEYVIARDGLIRKDLIAFDGTLFQVLALPPKPVFETPPASFPHSVKKQRNAEISRLIQQSLWEAHDGQRGH